MRLSWITVFEPIDNENMQEVHYEPDKKLRKEGKRITYCRACGNWVSSYDYRTYCIDGHHECSTPVEIPEKKENGS